MQRTTFSSHTRCLKNDSIGGTVRIGFPKLFSSQNAFGFHREGKYFPVLKKGNRLWLNPTTDLGITILVVAIFRHASYINDFPSIWTSSSCTLAAYGRPGRPVESGTDLHAHAELLLFVFQMALEMASCAWRTILSKYNLHECITLLKLDTYLRILFQ